MKREPTAEGFLKDVQHHEMHVLKDEGLYRHLKYRAKENGWNMWFEILTWPGCLTIHGDMGTWTFSRLDDMFNFFRSSKGLSINASYWADKLQHGVHGGSDGAKVWEEESFRERLVSQLSDYYGLEGSDLETVREDLENDVLCQDGKYDLLTAARDFSCNLPDREFEFDTCELPDGMEYAYHFIWCLYAIVWGIQQWDDFARLNFPERAA